VYQYLPYLQNLGFDVEVYPFTDPQLFQAIHRNGGNVAKLGGLGSAVIRRLSLLRRMADVDVVFLHREAFPFGPPLLEMTLARHCKSVVFSFDDALYARYPYATGLSRRVAYRFKYGRNLGTLISRCAAVVAGNDVLARYARQYNERVEVIPTAVDTIHYAGRGSVARKPDVVTIGWMGSPSTSIYLRQIEGSLQKIEGRYGSRVQFRFVGDPAFHTTLRSAEVRSWNASTEISDLEGFDIGLMPLLDSEWTRGKCAFKAVQYMAAEAPVVASPVGASEAVVREGVTGMLAKSPDDWVNALSSLIEQPRLRELLGKNGRAWVEERFSVKATLPALVKVLTEAAAKPRPSKQAPARSRSATNY